jgi:hypothetical protein
MVQSSEKRPEKRFENDGRDHSSKQSAFGSFRSSSEHRAPASAQIPNADLLDPHDIAFRNPVVFLDDPALKGRAFRRAVGLA